MRNDVIDKIPISKCRYLSSNHPKDFGNNSYFEVAYYTWNSKKRNVTTVGKKWHKNAQKWRPASTPLAVLQIIIYSISYAA